MKKFKCCYFCFISFRIPLGTWKFLFLNPLLNWIQFYESLYESKVRVIILHPEACCSSKQGQLFYDLLLYCRETYPFIKLIKRNETVPIQSWEEFQIECRGARNTPVVLKRIITLKNSKLLCSFLSMHLAISTVAAEIWNGLINISSTQIAYLTIISLRRLYSTKGKS